MKTIDKTSTTVSAEKVETSSSRRKFFKKAGTVAVAAPLAGFPMISVAQSPIVLKMQGGWGATDIFNDMAKEYVTRVNEMSGGRLRIDYLNSGSVVKTFEMMDAVSNGVLDAGHQVSAYWYGKSKVASLFGSGPVTGINSEQLLGWVYRGGGMDLYNELLKQLKLNVTTFFAFPMPPQPLGWFKSTPPRNGDELKGYKYRTVGLAADLMQELGMSVTQLPGGEIMPAMERGVIDAFEFNNPTSDRAFGAQDVAKYYSMGSFHQSQEFFEITFNKTKFESLPPDLQSILRYAAEAASSSNTWTAQDNYSRDLQRLIVEDKVRVVKTPTAVFDAQMKAWDTLTDRLMAEDPFFKKVVDSQLAWSRRVAYYGFLADANYKAAYEHVFKTKLPF
jgi:TRAP-type mannitol/chloroaromatic compound transport system substrate-binding protein